MPLETEFKQHLHSLMVEVSDATREEAERHKRELVFKAHQTHNSAAVPIAYKDAKLFDMELRVGKTIEKYIEAVAIWGFTIDAAFEHDMIQTFLSLTAGPNQFQLPPMIKGSHAQAVQGAFARERAQLANRLVREGTNRLKELKMKNKRQQSQPSASSHTTNTFNVSAQNAFINSPHSSVVQNTNNIVINEQVLCEIDRLSEGHPELQAAASELRAAHTQGGNVVDKVQRWVTLANAASGLAVTIHQHYPRVVALIEQLTRLGSN